ncbi:MAG: creatininase family protein, partial [Succinatimonas hippei]|nr:creatininase family protein [Succinatimonas hippei]
EHAAVTETSLIMYLKPELVRVDLIPENVKAKALPYSVYPPRAQMVPSCGALAASEGSSAQKGKLMVDKAIEGFLKIFKVEFGV